MDIAEKDKQIKDKVYDVYRNIIPMFGVELQKLISDVLDLKNEHFKKMLMDEYDKRVEELAQKKADEKAKDINGIPVRTLVAKDILNTLINRQCVDASNKELAESAVALTDELLKELKK
jgi:glucan phosphorylase